MSMDFNADDIFEMAEQIERNGAAFYRIAAEGIDDPKNRNMLLELAAMEDDHEKTFAGMRAELSAKDKEASLFDPEGEASLYLKALADTRVFFEKTVDTSSMVSILKEAITAEKDSIVFYLGMKDLVPEKFGKSRIDGLIREEMAHIKLLSQELVQHNK